MSEKEKIKIDYINGIKQKEICDKYDISINTLKSWIKRYKWAEEKRNKGAPKNKRGAPLDDYNKVSEDSKKHKSRLTRSSYPLQARPGNKNAVKTGEFETIFFDTLEEDELNLIRNIEVEKKKLLEQEIQLFTVRERRMLKRIELLKEKEMTLVSTKSGVEKGMDTELNEYEANLGQIQSIEEALTRVQDKKQKAIDSLHKFELDEQKLELTVMKLELEIMKQGGQEDEVEDDGFIGALESQVGDAWDD
ncbi:phage terminase small subunit [Paraclostridium sordellii]|uniref:phage terminase small subunit n=1 Tax=Paraclostridium sordellii TaxID=1505 RepID=UPI0005DCF6DD|nr:helix-turn-helix domain-containing protein [Paeniclostridium sordellii]CEN80988.1 DNA-binding protein [[Clostridium] sordellii] [Paeniclostridium sordellii]